MSKENPWSEGLAEALIGAGRTTEGHHRQPPGKKSTFEERLETFFDAFCLLASEEQWYKCCAQVDDRTQHPDHKAEPDLDLSALTTKEAATFRALWEKIKLVEE